MMAFDLRVPIPAGRFAERLVAHDLPRLDDARRAQTLAFVESRLAVLPGPMSVGVAAVAAAVGALAGVVGYDRTVRLLSRRAIPVVRDYVRLIRSLAVAYAWETWPHSMAGSSSASLSPRAACASSLALPSAPLFKADEVEQ